MIPACQQRGEIRGDTCECRSNRLIQRVPGRVMLETCAACPYADKPNVDRPPPPTFDCSHRGEATRTEQCKLCGSRETPVEIMRCAIHGECTVHAYGLTAGTAGAKLPVCISCESRA